MAVDQHVQKMIEELREALIQALRSSTDVTEAARKIRSQGLNIHLVMSFGGDFDIQPAETADASQAVTSKIEETIVDSVPEPTFRLSGNDVQLLGSLGIDATRRVRTSGRKRRRPPLSDLP